MSETVVLRTIALGISVLVFAAFQSSAAAPPGGLKVKVVNEPSDPVRVTVQAGQVAVTNIFNPADHPYQKQVYHNGPIASWSSVEFPPAPPGYRIVVQNINGFVRAANEVAEAPTLESCWTLARTTGDEEIDYDAGRTLISRASSRRESAGIRESYTEFDQSVLIYLEPEQVLVITCTLTGGSEYSDRVFTIAGYLHPVH